MKEEWQIGIALAPVVAAFILWAIRKYRKITADGVITIEEVIDTITEAADELEEVIEITEDMIEEEE